jgi:hypothetical protein
VPRRYTPFPVSPFAPLESQRVASGVLGFLGLFQMIKDGIRPGPRDPTKWYDRAIHVIGGTLILLLLGTGLVLWIIERLKGPH